MIETPRLLLKPLNYHLLEKYLQCDGSLEIALNLNETTRSISPALQEALTQTILPSVATQTAHYEYHTLWTAILKEEKKMIGDCCIIAEPNQYQEIEIGYGTYDAFQGRGYMTEIVGGIIEWSKKQLLTKSIIASTEKNNIASCKVLQRNAFIKVKETEAMIHWKLELYA
ncbi:MAG: N-acetyltransferase [Cytophagales bacterium]|nr:MAG: N-acetyltransferase [Cytophagales bacterium]